MSKEKVNKEKMTKKEPTKNLKEKRAAKAAKRNEKKQVYIKALVCLNKY